MTTREQVAADVMQHLRDARRRLGVLITVCDDVTANVVLEEEFTRMQEAVADYLVNQHGVRLQSTV
jgi:hypothetical protein